MQIYKEKEHRGYTCKVYYDPDPIAPSDWETFGTLYSCHRRYDPCGHNMSELLESDDDGGFSVDDNYIYVFVYYYEHSGITIHSSRCQQSCGWDSGLFGLYAVTKQRATNWFGDINDPDKYEDVLKDLENEVKEWDAYFRGDVFGYEISKDGEFVDSCGSFYDGPEYTMKAAIEVADYYADKVEKCEMICEPFWID